MAAFSVHEMSMGFQGQVLHLSDTDEKLAILKPLLEKLPWDKGSLKLGCTWEEMGCPERIARISCIPHYTLQWQGKQLNIIGDDGGPGDGRAYTDSYYGFDAIARPMYTFEQPKLTLLEPECVLEAEEEDAPLVADLTLLSVTVSSPGFDGIVLNLTPDDMGKLAPLEPLLEKLPWGKKALKLGKTAAEMGNPESYLERSCPTFYTLNWRGKMLNVEGETGGPGDGQVFTDAWNDFNAAARPMYTFEQPKLILLEPEPILVEEKEAPLVAELTLLSVTVSSPGYDGIVLNLTPNDTAKLAPLEPLLEKLPWEKNSLKLGKTAAEMGNPESYLERSCPTFYTLNWKGKTLNVEGETGGPGDGQVFMDAWNTFNAVARPMYKFEEPKLMKLEPCEAVLLPEK